MKIIFSRKGFDKRNGGVASPIFADDNFRSLPVPAEGDQEHPPAPRYRVTYKALPYRDVHLGSVVEDLTFNPRKRKPRIRGTDFCHLDPDLIRGDRTRKPGWLPMFGQSGRAASHLLNHGVREGDVFLFFGWFHRVRKVDRHFRYDPERLDAHIIFGWLQVGEVWCRFDPGSFVPRWARYHPHIRGEVNEIYNLSRPVDVVFIATRRLNLPGIRRHLPGGGVFPAYHKSLCLSSLEKGRRHWRLPAWMYPVPGRPPLTYHRDRRRWHRAGRWSLLRTVDIGQEFVLDAEYYPKAYQWLAGLFQAVA